VYGVTAYMVAQRTNEIGIRMALGADCAKVIHLVLRGPFQRVAAGLVVGLSLAVGPARLMAAQFYDTGTSTSECHDALHHADLKFAFVKHAAFG
jgi:hypothetical protein